jgi:hypothetical protein
MVGSVLLPELLPPLPEPGLLPLPEPPHPMMNKTWSATANEQREERKSLGMRYSRHANGCALRSFFCLTIFD